MAVLYRSSTYDDVTYKILCEIGYSGPCRCFDRCGLNEGHDINPPCETIKFVEKIIKIVRKG